mgnify:CR=1 FL=1
MHSMWKSSALALTLLAPLGSARVRAELQTGARGAQLTRDGAQLTRDTAAQVAYFLEP